jgi:hypothetical protein
MFSTVFQCLPSGAAVPPGILVELAIHPFLPWAFGLGAAGVLAAMIRSLGESGSRPDRTSRVRRRRAGHLRLVNARA